MTFDDERKFEDAVIEQLMEYGWEREVINYPTEEELIRNWLKLKRAEAEEVSRIPTPAEFQRYYTL